MYGYYSIRVFPFGDLRVNACLQLIVAFRSLPRPSSALSAKASTVCPYSLDLFCTCHISMTGPPLTILRMYHQCLFSTFVSSLAKKLSFSICSVGNCFYLLQKNFSIIHCVVFKEPYEFTFSSSLKIKQLKLSCSLSQTFDVFAAIAAP